MGVRIELNWPNKDRFLLSPSDASGKPVWVDRSHPAASEVRLTSFEEAVGEVGNDPHADNLLFTGDSLDAARILCTVPEFSRHHLGKVELVYIDPPFNTGKVFEHYDDWLDHSTWLSFMHDRLVLIRELLTRTGTVWIHLDDVEQHRMRCLLDEVFGSACFVTEVTWQKKYKPGNSRGIHSVTNPILVYSRTPEWRRHRGLPPPESQTAKYTLRDDRGRHRLTHAGVPTYLDDLIAKGAMPTNWWPHTEVGHGETATRESEALFGTKFDTPKPEALLQRVLHVASSPGDLVVDLFAGSGTTAAVAHKMGRRWVTCERSAEIVDKFTLPRLRAVAGGTDPGGITAECAWTGGGGFRTVQVGPSMYEVGPAGVVLLTDGRPRADLARAVAGQLGFAWDGPGPLCATRGATRLAVLDGPVGPEDVEVLVAQLAAGQTLTLVATTVLPGAEARLRELRPGSRIHKTPRDVLGVPRRSRRSSSRTASSTTTGTEDTK